MHTKHILMLCAVFFIIVSTATLVQAQGYVVYTEPTERAFSFEAPQGWNVQAGLYRNPANSWIDVRPYIRATSPDGNIIMTRWDNRFQSYFRTQKLSGVQFAEWYLNNYPEVGTSRITITARDNRGMVNYRCYKNGLLMAGAIAAQTYSLGSGMYLNDLFAYLAPVSQENLAYSLTSHMVETSKWDPQWSNRNAQNAQNYLQQYKRATNQVYQYSISQMAYVNGVFQPIMNNWINYIGGAPCWDCRGETICRDYQPYSYCTPI